MSGSQDEQISYTAGELQFDVGFGDIRTQPGKAMLNIDRWRLYTAILPVRSPCAVPFPALESAPF
jgi:hypothetical protein